MDDGLAIAGSLQQVKQRERPFTRYWPHAKLPFEKAEARTADIAFGGGPGANGNFQESDLTAHTN
jgi:hypothetical protein